MAIDKTYNHAHDLRFQVYGLLKTFVTRFFALQLSASYQTVDVCLKKLSKSLSIFYVEKSSDIHLLLHLDQ